MSLIGPSNVIYQKIIIIVWSIYVFKLWNMEEKFKGRCIKRDWLIQIMQLFMYAKRVAWGSCWLKWRRNCCAQTSRQQASSLKLDSYVTPPQNKAIFIVRKRNKLIKYNPFCSIWFEGSL